MLDKNTVKLVASEYDLLVVDKEEVSVTDAAKKTNDFLELDDLDHAVGVLGCGLGGFRGFRPKPYPSLAVCVCARHQLCWHTCRVQGSKGSGLRGKVFRGVWGQMLLIADACVTLLRLRMVLTCCPPAGAAAACCDSDGAR